jgi:hypothetical protein
MAKNHQFNYGNRILQLFLGLDNFLKIQIGKFFTAPRRLSKLIWQKLQMSCDRVAAINQTSSAADASDNLLIIAARLGGKQQ